MSEYHVHEHRQPLALVAVLLAADDESVEVLHRQLFDAVAGVEEVFDEVQETASELEVDRIRDDVADFGLVDQRDELISVVDGHLVRLDAGP